MKADQRGGSASALPNVERDEYAIEALREILLTRDRAAIESLAARSDELHTLITDQERLAATVTPIIAIAIRRKIRDARDEMAEALYPVIAQAVLRAVAEAINDLARRIDAQVQGGFGLRTQLRHLTLRLRGVPASDATLRELLPFSIVEVFLIHRQSGLLLWHSSAERAVVDQELVSAMLTAIRDFVRDAFGPAGNVSLDAIDYGSQEILIESAQYAYLAVVVEGVPPSGFRAAMRERIIEINAANEMTLRDYTGDPTALSAVAAPLASLRQDDQPRQVPNRRGCLLLGTIGFVLSLLLLAGACWGGRALLAALPTPAPVVVVVTPPPAPTPLPTATPVPTLTPVPTPLPTRVPTPAPTPVAILGTMIGDVWLRDAPSNDSRRLGTVVEAGQRVEVLRTSDEWTLIRWTLGRDAEIVGWIPSQWVARADQPR